MRALNIHPEGHTRLPRYVRGHVGEIVRVHGTHVFPDSNAQGLGEDPHWLYAVSFSASELWGHDTADSSDARSLGTLSRARSMNGAHDLGGMMGFGPIAPEPNEPVFHEEWERRLFAVMSAVGDVGGWSIDEDRSACESMSPADYLESSYYEHWLHGLETCWSSTGCQRRASLRAAMHGRPRKDIAPPTRADEVWTLHTAPGSYVRAARSACPLQAWR